MRNVSVAFLALALIGCGDSGTTTEDGATNNPDMTVAGGFKQPAGTVAINFSVDDTANKVYVDEDLQWKGSMIYDATTRLITKDDKWGGPWAPLYDDGPWDQGTPPGHEPKGSVKGDHKFGITVFATPPATASDKYEYGLNDNVYQTKFNNGWVWQGSNGSFEVKAGATDAVNAQGQTFAAFGTNDIRITMDKANIDMTGAWDTTKVRIKGTFTSWATSDITEAAGKFVFTLSDVVGNGKTFAHSGLTLKGDKPEFIFVLGAGDGKEYKDAGGKALSTGITAEVKAAGGAFAPVSITLAGNNNTTFTVP